MIYVARQLGHGAEMTMRVYGHVVEELEDAPSAAAEEVIRTETGNARVRVRVRDRRAGPRLNRNLWTSKRPEQDSNLRPTP